MIIFVAFQKSCFYYTLIAIAIGLSSVPFEGGLISKLQGLAIKKYHTNKRKVVNTIHYQYIDHILQTTISSHHVLSIISIYIVPFLVVVYSMAALSVTHITNTS